MLHPRWSRAFRHHDAANRRSRFLVFFVCHQKSPITSHACSRRTAGVSCFCRALHLSAHSRAPIPRLHLEHGSATRRLGDMSDSQLFLRWGAKPRLRPRMAARQLHELNNLWHSAAEWHLQSGLNPPRAPGSSNSPSPTQHSRVSLRVASPSIHVSKAPR